MSWQDEKEEAKAKVSQASARDIVEAIDELIIIRMKQILSQGSEYRSDDVEIIKRKITDYLLVTDPRHGVFFQP